MLHMGCYCLVALMLGFAGHAVRGSHNCSLFRARLCWGGGGGSVAFEGFVLNAGGVYALYPNVMLLVEMVYVRSGINASKAVRHLTCAPESGC